MFDDTGRTQYGHNLVCLINGVRKEFKAPKMPVVVGVIGVNGVLNEAGKQKDVRDGQRFVNTVPEFKGNVKAVEIARLLDPRIVALRDGRLAQQGPRPQEAADHRRGAGHAPAGQVEQGIPLLRLGTIHDPGRARSSPTRCLS